MVYGLIGQAASRPIIRAGIKVGRGLFKELGKYDRGLHQRVFGRSGGRGFRHGRDAGLTIGSTLRTEGDALDSGSGFQPQYSSRKQPQAYSRYGNRRGTRRRSNYCRPRKVPRRSYSR